MKNHHAERIGDIRKGTGREKEAGQTENAREPKKRKEYENERQVCIWI